jgi:hypothetical protein
VDLNTGSPGGFPKLIGNNSSSSTNNTGRR